MIYRRGIEFLERRAMLAADGASTTGDTAVDSGLFIAGPGGSTSEPGALPVTINLAWGSSLAGPATDLQVSFQGGSADTELFQLVLEGSQIPGMTLPGDIVFGATGGQANLSGTSISTTGGAVLGVSETPDFSELIISLAGFTSGDLLDMNVSASQVAAIDPVSGSVATVPIVSNASLASASFTAQIFDPSFQSVTLGGAFASPAADTATNAATASATGELIPMASDPGLGGPTGGDPGGGSDSGGGANSPQPPTVAPLAVAPLTAGVFGPGSDGGATSAVAPRPSGGASDLSGLALLGSASAASTASPAAAIAPTTLFGPNAALSVATLPMAGVSVNTTPSAPPAPMRLGAAGVLEDSWLRETDENPEAPGDAPEDELSTPNAENSPAASPSALQSAPAGMAPSSAWLDTIERVFATALDDGLTNEREFAAAFQVAGAARATSAINPGVFAVSATGAAHAAWPNSPVVERAADAAPPSTVPVD